MSEEYIEKAFRISKLSSGLWACLTNENHDLIVVVLVSIVVGHFQAVNWLETWIIHLALFLDI